MEPITLRRIARASSTIATPYSTTMVRSTAALRSPTSTPSPWLLLARAPGMRSRIAPIARCAATEAGDPVHLPCGHTGDLRHHGLGDCGLTLAGFQIAAATLSRDRRAGRRSCLVAHGLRLVRVGGAARGRDSTWDSHHQPSISLSFREVVPGGIGDFPERRPRRSAPLPAKYPARTAPHMIESNLSL
jgi:hypothetical protein